MKKILCYIDELGSGGAERQITYLAVLLKKVGYDVNVFCYHPEYFYEHVLTENGVNLIKIKLKKNNYYYKFKNTWNAIKQSGAKNIIAYSDGPVMIASIIKFFKPSLNVIVSERNTTQRLSKREKIKFFLYRMADHIVANSHTQSKFIKSHFKNLENKTVVITNYIDTIKFHPIQHSPSENICRIIVVARHSKQKNVPTFIEAVKIAKAKGVKFHVDWYGDDGGGNKAEHVAYAFSLGVDDILTFHDSKSDIENYYVMADVFCLPSLYEGFPNVVCEAMSCGLPVICSSVCDNPDLIEESVGGFLFNPKSKEDIAEKIGLIAATTEEKKIEMGNHNRIKAEKLFTADVFVEKYIKLIESI